MNLSIDELDWGEVVAQSALDYLRADRRYIKATGDNESLTVAALVAEKRLLYALLRWYATSAGDIPECIDDHLECWLSALRQSGVIPSDWPSLIEAAGT